jgi:hypothetical protein
MQFDNLSYCDQSIRHVPLLYSNRTNQYFAIQVDKNLQRNRQDYRSTIFVVTNIKERAIVSAQILVAIQNTTAIGVEMSMSND